MLTKADHISRIIAVCIAVKYCRSVKLTVSFEKWTFEASATFALIRRSPWVISELNYAQD